MDRVVLITGAGRGIGAATARLAARRGYSVCVNYRHNREAAEAVVRDIEEAGARAVAAQADVGVEAEVMRLFETSDRLLGPLRALVNNAGVLETQMRVEAMDAARLGAPGEYVDYAASKGALDTMTIGLAQEVAGEGIRVNGVRAGFIYTEMHASGGEPNRVERVKAFVPMKRGGTADEVAAAVLWLLSDEASFTIGSFVDVTGGR